MARYNRDPHWITVRYLATCTCGVHIQQSDRAWYWPIGKKLECIKCGKESERRFILETT